MQKLAILVGLAMALALALPGSTDAAALIEMKKLTASDAQAEDIFGESVAVSGDTAIVGAFRGDAGGFRAGAAYVFERNQSGADDWGEVTKLTASDAGAGDQFGVSVAGSGDTAVVGAPLQDAGASNAGAAYVFERDQGDADNWGEVKKLTASDAQADDLFGWSVAVSGDTAVVGVELNPHDYEDAEGAAYVFQRDQGGTGNWGEVKRLTASGTDAFGQFGASVAVSGDTAVVGAPLAYDSGAAYVFQRDQGGTGNWGQVTMLHASGTGAFFGHSVAVSGDTAVVGDGSEAAYVFQRDQGGAYNWGEVKRLTASDAQANDDFSWSVAVSGDTAVVGARFASAAGTDAGAAYVFRRDQGGAGNWGEVKKLTSSDAQVGDNFGNSVAISGDTAVVGAPHEDAGGDFAGAAYVFQVPPKQPNGDTDNDGCLDTRENGLDETLGGRRDYLNFWDFVDPNRDRAVGLLDFLAVLRHFGTVGDPAMLDLDAPEPPPGEYWALADRGGQAPGGDPWDELPANGSIGLSDFLSVLRQFGHTCA